MVQMELDQDDDGSTCSAAVGDEILLTLAETPTSGYRWAPAPFDETILASVDDAYSAAESARLGASGTRRFRFAVVGPGRARLTVTLRRSWEPDTAAESFQATIVASRGGDPLDPGAKGSPP
jgi:inhibitor of cysteine peptidase